MIRLLWIGVGVVVVGLAAGLVMAYGYKALKAAHTRPAGRGRSGPQPRSRGMESAAMKLISTVIRTSLRLGLRAGPMMLLTVIGRTSGKPRSNPVDVFRKDGKAWLVATHDANANWVRNLRAAGGGQLSLGRRRFSFTARELARDEAGDVLYEVLAPRLRRRWAGVVLRQTLGVPPDAPRGEFVEASDSHPVFEVQLTRLRRGASGLEVATGWQK